MEFLEKNLTEEWQKLEPEQVSGLEDWQIGRHETLPDGKFRYALRDLKGRRMVAYLQGKEGRKDPLYGVANCQLKIDGDQIVGINVEGDCAAKTNSIAITNLS